MDNKSSPQYFNLFPDIEYSARMNKAGVVDYVNVKDFFHMMQLKDTFYRDLSLFDPYYIKNGERPDRLADMVYGNPRYYWVILQTNDIVDYENQWPLSQTDLDAFILKKYGSYEAASQPHHYETLRVTDIAGNILLPGRGSPEPERAGLALNGIKVPENFEFEYAPNPNNPSVTRTLRGSTGNSPACYMVSNRQYEYDINEDKCQINIMRPKYIADFMRDYKMYSRMIRRTGEMKGILSPEDFYY